MTNNVNYNSTIRDMIIMNLDGWRVEVPEEVETVETIEGPVTIETTENTETTTASSNDVNPFMTSTEANMKANKTISDTECQLFYEEALDQAYMYTNRLNIDDLSSVEARVFIRGVCKWAASNLWNKYNIRVNNEDMEDTYIQSYGGLLYNSALKTLQQFINQRVIGLSSFREDSSDDLWPI